MDLETKKLDSANIGAFTKGSPKNKVRPYGTVNAVNKRVAIKTVVPTAIPY